jgi:translocation and assembly module TamA
MYEIIALKEWKPAYSGTTYMTGVMIHRPVTETTSLGIGVKAETSKLKRSDENYHPTLGGIPVEVKSDWSDNFLNPSQGIRFRGLVTPYWGTLKKSYQSTPNTFTSNREMTIAQGNFSFYIPLRKNEQTQQHTVLASFIRGGSVLIKSLDLIPPNKRFYCGGGDSVRAYGPQKLGPLDSSLIPLGGRSLVELGTEARFPLTQDLGGTLFIEGGHVSSASVAGLKYKDFLWGWGFGARYFSKIGPLRFDLAFPFKKRKDSRTGKRIDSPFQFYVSIGQAF